MNFWTRNTGHTGNAPDAGRTGGAGPAARWAALRRTVRYRLVCLVLTCVVPVGLAAAALLYTAYREKRANVSRNMLETTRSFSKLMDRKLDGALATLRVLATCPSLASGNYAAFHGQALTALADHPGADIILADAAGQQVYNSSMPPGAPLPQRTVPERVRVVFETGQARVSGAYRGAISGRLFVSVDVPVRRDGRTVFDLAMTLPVDTLIETLSLPNLPPEWTATILDSQDLIVARTPDQEGLAGQPARMPTLARHREKAPEGVLRAVGLGGEPIFAGYSHSAASGWTMVVSVPKATVMRQVWLWTACALAGAILLGVLGVVVALRQGHRIAGSIKALVGPATALGRGEPVAVGPLEFAETREVGESLLQASRLLREQEEALRESEERYRTVVHTANEGIWMVDRDNITTYVNPRMAEMLGYAPEELAGRPRRDSIFPQDLEDHEARRLHRQSGGISRYERRMRRKDGSEAWFILSSTPLFGRDGGVVGGVGMYTDITERRNAQEALAESEERYRSFFTGMESIKLIIDPADGAIADANPAAVAFYGYSLERLRGMFVYDLNVLPREQAMAEVEEARTAGKRHLAYRHRLADGDIRDMDVYVAMLRYKDRQLIMASMHDVTELRRLERIKADVERIVRHDLRSPLSGIINIPLLLLNDGNLTPEQREMLGLLSASGGRMLGRINASLEMHKIETGAYQPRAQACDPGELVRQCVRLLAAGQEFAAERVVIREQGLGDGDAPTLRTDGPLLDSIVTNLLRNALEAGDGDGPVFADLAWEGGEFSIAVSNDHPVPAEVRNRFFEKYATAGKTQGTGLGTYSAALMTRALGGAIAMETSDESGTRVTVRIPNRA